MNQLCESQNTSFPKNRYDRPRSSQGLDWVSVAQGRQRMDSFQTPSWTGSTVLCSLQESSRYSRGTCADGYSDSQLQRSSWQQDLIGPYNVIE
jgi:hypothetical protein